MMPTSRLPLLKNTVVVHCDCGCKRNVRTSLKALRIGRKVFFEKACNIRFNSEHPSKP
jgi:hypothetical protein